MTARHARARQVPIYTGRRHNGGIEIRRGSTFVAMVDAPSTAVAFLLSLEAAGSVRGVILTAAGERAEDELDGEWSVTGTQVRGWAV